MIKSGWRFLLRRVTAYLGEHEKGLLALLSVVIMISGTVWFHQYANTNSQTPSQGGTYVDGVVGNRQALEDEAAHLTKAGLFTFNSDGTLTDLLISDWSVNDNQTVYRFRLRPNISLGEIRDALTLESSLLGGAVVSSDHNELVVTLQSADPSLPLLLAEPLFDYGPYKISKLTNQSAILVRNTRAGAVSPYINRVIINAYKNEADLLQAIKQHKVNGARVSAATTIRGYQTHSYSLPLYYTVFFNLNRTPFRDQSFGQKLAAGSAVPDQPFTLIAPNNQPYQSIAKDLVSQWQAAGAQVTLSLKSETEIDEQVAPSRDFQAMLGGVDYGYELDPFYLWDESQVRPPGNNFTGIKNNQIEDQIGQIRRETNVTSRRALIETLHQTLQSQGVAEFVGEQKAYYLTAQSIRALDPWTPDSPTDYLQAFALWSVR